MQNNINPGIFILKFIKLFIGFFVLALGIVIMYKAGIGMTPWGTFHVGLMKVAGLTLGRISQIVGLLVILLSMFLKIYPGIATVLNMFFIGFFIDLINPLNIYPQPGSKILQCLMCLAGLWIFSLGIYLYISCGLGAGPRDGLMVGLIKITGFSASYIKPAIEITILISGIILGGPFGIGTFLIAILGGKFLDIIFNIADYDPAETEHLSFLQFFKLIRSYIL
ncbi:MAG: membrane protein [Candidatus Mcinerneyibacterium aminivorans]|jgi:uncharacterized membrane protein YczE|uniref:Membrane protein n=1 Tax=Candidatus Mcinerneyibacterium aminivorans TaxID=2703815 RepID=A0A5D0M9Y1_9BACT|nr:MAG: membrane protein [Candidatus Mcinerneyibacterium aminivorans]